MKLKEQVGFSINEKSIVLPCKKDYKPKSWGVGGVIDQDGKFIDSSGLYMNWISFGESTISMQMMLNMIIKM